MAFARPQSIKCPSSVFNLLQTSMNSEKMPPNVVPTAAFDVQCVGTPFEGRLIVQDTTVQDFNDQAFTSRGCPATYTIFPISGHNEMFPPTAFYSSHLVNSSKDRLFNFVDPAGRLGWLGGCGVMVCAG